MSSSISSDRHNPGMADTDEAETWLDTLTRDEQFWLGEFCQRGLTLSQAEVLATQPQLDRHAVREALSRGCDPDTAFMIYAN